MPVLCVFVNSSPEESPSSAWHDPMWYLVALKYLEFFLLPQVNCATEVYQAPNTRRGRPSKQAGMLGWPARGRSPRQGSGQATSAGQAPGHRVGRAGLSPPRQGRPGKGPGHLGRVGAWHTRQARHPAALLGS